MTNINLSILFGSGLLGANSESVTVIGEYIDDIFLEPMYAIPSDVMGVFAEDIGSYEQQIKKLIFENSIKADQMFTPERVTTLRLTPEMSFMLKRQFVICSSIYRFGDIFFRDYLKSVKKSKFLADFKVSLEVEKDPTLIKKIIDDAKECMDEIAGMLSVGFNFETFSKGSCNPCNLKRPYREWWPSEGGNRPNVPLAASKASDFFRIYKIGAN